MKPTGVLLLIVLLPSGVGAISEPPAPVSPTSGTGNTVVADVCPTFHWSGVRSAKKVEVAVFRVQKGHAQNDEATVDKVAQAVLDGAAQGWTPSLDQCLHRGQNYAWGVRARYGRGWSKWSDPQMFSVSGESSLEELEEALGRLLERYIEQGRLAPTDLVYLRSIFGASPDPAQATRGQSTTELLDGSETPSDGLSPPAAGRVPTTIPSASAVSAEIQDGMAFLGRSTSTSGVGGYFQNIGGGIHLAAGGSSQQNPDFVVDAVGGVSATSFTGSGLGLSGVNADKLDGKDSTDFIEEIVAGSGLTGGGTSGTVTLSIGADAIGSTEIVDGSVATADLEPGAASIVKQEKRATSTDFSETAACDSGYELTGGSCSCVRGSDFDREVRYSRSNVWINGTKWQCKCIDPFDTALAAAYCVKVSP